MRRLGCFVALVLIVASFGLPAIAQGPQSAKAPVCPLSALLDSVTATTKITVVTAPLATPIYINGVATANPNGPRLHLCDVVMLVNQTTGAADYGLVYGTGTNCGTGKTNLTPQFVGTASIKETTMLHFGSDGAISPPSGKDVCLALSAAPTKAQVFITYGYF